MICWFLPSLGSCWPKIGLAALLALASMAAAHAQIVPSGPNQPSAKDFDAGSVGTAGPIEGGKDLQPKGVPTQSGAADADRLLRAGEHSPAAHEPPVVPRDLYGQPMGGSPGLSPPDPDPHHETTAPRQ